PIRRAAHRVHPRGWVRRPPWHCPRRRCLRTRTCRATSREVLPRFHATRNDPAMNGELRGRVRLLQAMAISVALTHALVLFALSDDPLGMWSLAGIVESPFFYVVVASAFILHAYHRPGRAELASTIGVASVLTGLAVGAQRVFDWYAMPIGI